MTAVPCVTSCDDVLNPSVPQLHLPAAGPGLPCARQFRGRRGCTGPRGAAGCRQALARAVPSPPPRHSVPWSPGPGQRASPRPPLASAGASPCLVHTAGARRTSAGVADVPGRAGRAPPRPSPPLTSSRRPIRQRCAGRGATPPAPERSSALLPGAPGDVGFTRGFPRRLQSCGITARARRRRSRVTERAQALGGATQPWRCAAHGGSRAGRARLPVAAPPRPTASRLRWGSLCTETPAPKALSEALSGGPELRRAHRVTPPRQNRLDWAISHVKEKEVKSFPFEGN